MITNIKDDKIYGEYADAVYIVNANAVICGSEDIGYLLWPDGSVGRVIRGSGPSCAIIRELLAIWEIR